MIIHYKDNFNNYQLSSLKPLKYSDSFTFIPIQILHKKKIFIINVFFKHLIYLPHMEFKVLKIIKKL